MFNQFDRPTERPVDFVVHNQGRFDAEIERQEREIAQSGRGAAINRQKKVMAALAAKRGN